MNILLNWKLHNIIYLRLKTRFWTLWHEDSHHLDSYILEVELTEHKKNPMLSDLPFLRATGDNVVCMNIV